MEKDKIGVIGGSNNLTYGWYTDWAASSHMGIMSSGLGMIEMPTSTMFTPKEWAMVLGRVKHSHVRKKKKRHAQRKG